MFNKDKYQLIGNNCIVGLLYDQLEIRQNNMFRYCCVDNYLNLLLNYDKINFNNFNLYGYTWPEGELKKEYNSYKTYPIVELEYNILLKYYHHNYDDIEKPFKKRYERWIDNFKFDISPIFILNETLDDNIINMNIDVFSFIKNHSDYNYIVITYNLDLFNKLLKLHNVKPYLIDIDKSDYIGLMDYCRNNILSDLKKINII